jgi:hypothetical protein
MEYNQEDQGAIDDTQGSSEHSEQSLGELWDCRVSDELVRDEGQLDDKASLPEQVREVKKRGPRRYAPEPTHRIPIETFGETPTDNALRELIKLGWRPTDEKIRRFREVTIRQMDIQPSVKGKYGDRSSRGVRPKALAKIIRGGY